jgi:hypothetical protein
MATGPLCAKVPSCSSRKILQGVPFWNTLYHLPTHWNRLAQVFFMAHAPKPAFQPLLEPLSRLARIVLKRLGSLSTGAVDCFMAIRFIQRRHFMLYAPPGSPDAKIQYKPRYDNFIGGKFVAPVKGGYFDVLTPITGKAYTQAARSTAEDIELALDAAHAAAAQWGRTPPAERSNILLKIADRIEQNLELLAYAETVDNGKAIRETLNADIPLTVDHFRYFAGCLRSQEGSLSEID